MTIRAEWRPVRVSGKWQLFIPVTGPSKSQAAKKVALLCPCLRLPDSGVGRARKIDCVFMRQGRKNAGSPALAHGGLGKVPALPRKAKAHFQEQITTGPGLRRNWRCSFKKLRRPRSDLSLVPRKLEEGEASRQTACLARSKMKKAA